MEDTDAFEMDDGWGCDSPSAVLSPSGVLSNPMDEGDVAVDDLNGDDFGWEDEETDKQFGITPPKPAPSPVMPPPGAPVPPPTASFASAAGDSLPSQAHQQSQEESTTTVTKQVPATTSVTETSSMAPLPVAKFGYAERDSWSETWDETESHSDRKDAPAATPGRLRVSATSLTVPAAESIPVANEFWGDQDDGALFDEDEHANDKWDESPAVQDTIADVSKLSLQDEEAAATLETAGAQQHQQSTFAPPPLASEPSPSSFGYSSGAHSYEPQGNVSFHGSNASFDASSEGHSSLPGELHGFGAATPPRAPGAAVSFAADKAESHLSSSSSDHVPSFSAPTAFSDRNEFGHDAPVSAFYGEKPPPVESPSANYFAASPLKDDFASSVADSIAFTQPQSEFHQHSDSGFGNNGYQQHEAQNDNQAAADPQKDWEVPESFGESGGDWGQSLNKDEHFDGDFHQQGGAVQVPPVHLEGESDHHQSGGQQAHSSSAYESSESDAFDYANRSSREETRFYASVRDHEGSSTASVGGDVSSSGATFGGSDYISDGPFSDGNFSETRSMVGSSNASTAFGTDFPSVSEGFSAAATTFGGSDYVSDGQYSDGNVSETPSLNESSNRSAETGSDLPAAGEERYFTETADHADESSPFEKPHSSGGAFNGGFPPAAPAALFNHEHAPSDEANPFASSASGFSASSERSFQPAPFGSAAPDSQSATDPVQESGYVASASSLFGPTAGSDVPNPFGSQPSSSSFVEKELPVADAGDLFGSAPPAAGFGSSFGQPPQQYGEQSYQAYGQVRSTPTVPTLRVVSAYRSHILFVIMCRAINKTMADTTSRTSRLTLVRPKLSMPLPLRLVRAVPPLQLSCLGRVKARMMGLTPAQLTLDKMMLLQVALAIHKQLKTRLPAIASMEQVVRWEASWIATKSEQTCPHLELTANTIDLYRTTSAKTKARLRLRVLLHPLLVHSETHRLGMMRKATTTLVITVLRALLLTTRHSRTHITNMIRRQLLVRWRRTPLKSQHPHQAFSVTLSILVPLDTRLLEGMVNQKPKRCRLLGTVHLKKMVNLRLQRRAFSEELLRVMTLSGLQTSSLVALQAQLTTLVVVSRLNQASREVSAMLHPTTSTLPTERLRIKPATSNRNRGRSLMLTVVRQILCTVMIHLRLHLLAIFSIKQPLLSLTAKARVETSRTHPAMARRRLHDPVKPRQMQLHTLDLRRPLRLRVFLSIPAKLLRV